MRTENSPDGQQRSFIEEARRRQIIASAVEVLAATGYSNASLARIAKHAGISKGVISYHFAGKDDLMTQVVIQLFVSGGEYMKPFVEAAEGARNQLRAYIESNLAFIDANRTFVAAMMEVVLNLRDADGALVFVKTGNEDEVIAPLVELLTDGQRAGEFGDFDATVTAKLVRDSIDGIAGRAVREPDFDVMPFAAALTRLFDLATTKSDQQ
ncbi:TetR/AcrR family fatty acid metabolism transcriptional regulator [Mycobacterium frederiksbergense]|uniref:TetR/AcrR family fatty acid metabolism transcriptional regulator n=1 Tax=Mycolicibacterium frederiksbergense TaxID=117567 RepID=A0ABT6L5H3_9MYCO|nr:TetR/AcrR family transcriptional regulator [Mycolicibacterium frederiksbergense]MDH6197866.1 TetR/AcrR family fatty acid metabolism transcriptional regulator [Mycolicibacterium frederiksbergense]